MNLEQVIKECTFKAVRSSGSGGQHVNKVATKIELQFNVNTSFGLDIDEKELLKESLKTRLTAQGILIIRSGETRSQLQNKERAINRLIDIISKGIEVPKERKKTNIPRSVIKKRLENKKRTSVKKASRKKPSID